MGALGSYEYLIALGSNRRHHRMGSPARVLDEALRVLAGEDIYILASTPALITRPIGPSRRSYANSAALIRTGLTPEALLALLKVIEARFGQRRGQRWSARTLDLDIILWSGGRWRTRRPWLTIPHPLFSTRSFVLKPAATIAPRWRDPMSGLTIRQLHSRCTQA